MKLFFDTEFTGLQKDTTLISLGVVAEDGSCFYGKFTDYNQEQVNDWIEDNVLAKSLKMIQFQYKSRKAPSRTVWREGT